MTDINTMCRHAAFHLPVYGVAAFILLNILAMFIYPGGTYQEPDLNSYKFTMNYFSDLGRTMTMNGTNNFFACFLFNLNLLMIGSLMVVFFYYLPELFKQNKTAYMLCRISSLIAITSGIAFAGVGLTPSDLYLDEHMFFVRWAFRSYLLVAVLFIPTILKAPEWKNKYAAAYVFFALFLLTYNLIMDFGPDGKETMEGLVFQVVAQKIIVLAFSITIMIKSLGARHNFKNLIQSG